MQSDTNKPEQMHYVSVSAKNKICDGGETPWTPSEDVRRNSTGNASRSKNANNRFNAVHLKHSSQQHSVARNMHKTEDWTYVVRLEWTSKRQCESERSRNASASTTRGGDKKLCFKETEKTSIDGDKRICIDERQWEAILASLRRRGGRDVQRLASFLYHTLLWIPGHHHGFSLM
jgi:hypothetical protein